MKIAIIGPGALGTLLAALLWRTKNEVWLIDKDPQRARHIREHGIRVEGITQETLRKVLISATSKEAGEADIVILAVKAFDTETALKRNLSLVGQRSCVVTLQNGFDNLQVIRELVGDERTIGGMTAHGATLLGNGQVRHAGKGKTVIGRVDGKLSGVLKRVSSLFNDAGIETRISTDIQAIVWSKLVINVGINAMTALLRLHNGALTGSEGTRLVMKMAVSEAVKICKRKRVKLFFDDPIQKVEQVCAQTAGNISSMLQDVLAGKRTEIEYINGAIVRQGRGYGIPTPVNEVLTELVKTLEQTYGKTVFGVS